MNQLQIKRTKGFTLIELMIVVAIIAVLSSIMVPKVGQLTRRAFQANAKGNLGTIRSTISIYYSDNEGKYPLQSYDNDNNALSNDNGSLTNTLTPRYMNKLPIPKVVDELPLYNQNCASYDTQAQSLMTQSPVIDVRLFSGPAGPLLTFCEPFGYDTNTGLVYVNNDSPDVSGNSIYSW